MTWREVSWVIEHSAAENAERLVAFVLAHHARKEDGLAWPSVPTIAKEARIGEATVRAAIASLLRAGELVETGTGPRGVRCFRFAMDDRTPPQREPRRRPYQRPTSETPPPQDLRPTPPQDLRGSPDPAPPQDLRASPDPGARPPQDLAPTTAGSAPEPGENRDQEPSELPSAAEGASPVGDLTLSARVRTDVAREADREQSGEEELKATVAEWAERWPMPGDDDTDDARGVA
jgi:hypothetical protein